MIEVAGSGTVTRVNTSLGRVTIYLPQTRPFERSFSMSATLTQTLKARVGTTMPLGTGLMSQAQSQDSFLGPWIRLGYRRATAGTLTTECMVRDHVPHMQVNATRISVKRANIQGELEKNTKTPVCGFFPPPAGFLTWVSFCGVVSVVLC